MTTVHLHNMNQTFAVGTLKSIVERQARWEEYDLDSPLKKIIRAAAGPYVRAIALRSLPESTDSTRSRALSSATMTRPRLQSNFYNGLLSALGC